MISVICVFTGGWGLLTRACVQESPSGVLHRTPPPVPCQFPMAWARARFCLVRLSRGTCTQFDVDPTCQTRSCGLTMTRQMMLETEAGLLLLMRLLQVCPSQLMGTSRRLEHQADAPIQAHLQEQPMHVSSPSAMAVCCSRYSESRPVTWFQQDSRLCPHIATVGPASHAPSKTISLITCVWPASAIASCHLLYHGLMHWGAGVTGLVAMLMSSSVMMTSTSTMICC